MKIKYNIPMLNNIKNGMKNIKSKIVNNKQNKLKGNIKYYTLLVLMLLIGTMSFSSNLKKYNDINSEDYTKYDTNQTIDVNMGSVTENYYETAISSISTNVSNLVEENGENVNNNDYIYPVNGEIIKDFAMETLVYSKTLDMWKTHQGIDIKADLASEVVAIQAGKVISVEQDNFYGVTVKIEHENGYISVYSNLDKLGTVEIGKLVKQGEAIGKVGVTASGEIADESHLHFEIIKANEWINPREVLE